MLTWKTGDILKPQLQFKLYCNVRWKVIISPHLYDRVNLTYIRSVTDVERVKTHVVSYCVTKEVSSRSD